MIVWVVIDVLYSIPVAVYKDASSAQNHAKKRPEDFAIYQIEVEL